MGLFLIFIGISFFPVFSRKIDILKILYDYEITIIINSIGTQNILNNNFPLPVQIYINNEQQTEIKYSYSLSNSENQIKLIWYNIITTCDSIFSGLNIVNADFSEE